MDDDVRRPAEPGVGSVLGPLGATVMRALWTRGPSSVAEVAEVINGQQQRQLAYTTVMTILTRLHGRGLVERTRAGRGFVYRPVADEPTSIDALAGRAVDEVLSRYGPAAFRQFGVRLGALDPELRSALLRLAEGETA